MSTNTKMKKYQSCNESKQEDAPEYKVITEENMYEFIIWCNELKPPSIEVNQFNMMLQTNIQNWIFENNITWQYAYTKTLDIILEQKKLTEDMNEKTYTEKIRPTSIQEKRKLFAERAEERMKNHFTKKKSYRK